MEELFKNLQLVLEKYGPILIEEYRKQLASGHNASGNLSNSLKYEVEYSSGTLELSIELEDYWKYLEHGTKAHWPNIDKIRQWIRVKPVAPRPMKNGKLPTENQLVYLISRKISLEGTKALNLFDKAENVMWESMLSEINSAVEKDISEDLDDILLYLWK